MQPITLDAMQPITLGEMQRITLDAMVEHSAFAAMGRCWIVTEKPLEIRHVVHSDNTFSEGRRKTCNLLHRTNVAPTTNKSRSAWPKAEVQAGCARGRGRKGGGPSSALRPGGGRAARAAGARFVDLALLQPAWPMRTAGDDSGQREAEFENVCKLMGNVCKLMVSVLKRL